MIATLSQGCCPGYTVRLPRLFFRAHRCRHIRKGVALFGLSSTVPELRRRGLQGTLLDERMRYAADEGCDLAMMVAEARSGSQKNAQRMGSQVAYTRMKWQLAPG